MKDLVSNSADISNKRREVHKVRGRLIISVILLLVVTAVVIVILLS